MKNLLLFVYLFVHLDAFAQTSIKWPYGAKAAICLTYDDGMDTQLSNAIPQLDSFGFKGTFFPECGH
jgi:peptidoglycan-N-acetylglucosamine deacetylase